MQCWQNCLVLSSDEVTAFIFLSQVKYTVGETAYGQEHEPKTDFYTSSSVVAKFW